ncbi:hypothetical protein [Alteromonas gilva]|uniref:Transglutaminase domain-containing protein n=1 Tax=Alteromonas gilva TaxID=2987522 RepID=A0ABT5L961_9ALTE|nr:hypothetical protein [Alteromonas gilva]MDC8833076.1 hypothetical protein [Alteromonas gilva]
MNSVIRSLCCGALWLAVCQASYGEQILYQRVPNAEGMKYTYGWLDHNNNPRKISFVLPLESTQSLPIQQVNYNPNLALRAVEIALIQAAQEIDPRVARFSLTKRYDSLEFSLTGKRQEVINTLQADLKATQEQAMNSYLAERYFERYTTPLLQKAIKPNHVRYIEESTLPLIPLAQSLYEIVDQQANARSYLNLLLSWVQSIPYDELTNRVSSNGSGFSPPLAVLNQNVGDCDSKSVLTAALIRAFLPANAMRLVLLNNHALLAIALTPLTKDTTLLIEGLPYVLLDPTGPAHLPLGEVSDLTKQQIASLQYTLEVIPPAASPKQ